MTFLMTGTGESVLGLTLTENVEASTVEKILQEPKGCIKRKGPVRTLIGIVGVANG